MLSKDSRVHQDSNFESGSPLKSVWAHSLTFSRTPRSVNVNETLKLHSWLAPFYAVALVASLRLGL
jgi:hypothetical protein